MVVKSFKQHPIEEKHLLQTRTKAETDQRMNVVIQGAGRGIGLALAHRARVSGANHLFLTAREPTSSKGFADLPPGPDITWLALDNLVPNSIEEAGEQIQSKVDKLDRVICCSGVLKDEIVAPEKRLADIDAGALTYVYQVNATGPILLAKALLPTLRGNHSLHFASISARVGSISDNQLGGWYAYRASKAAQNQLMRTLSIEMTRYNPNTCVTTLHPGTVDTALSKPFQAHVHQDSLFTAESSAAMLWSVLDRLKPTDTGGFFAYDGSPIPF